MWGTIIVPTFFVNGTNNNPPTDNIHLIRAPAFHRYLGNSLAMVMGLYSAASRSTPQPASAAGWIELLRYSLMPLSDFARRRSPCPHRSSMAMPPLPPCRDHSVTESASSGCLSASRPYTLGSFRRWRIRSHCARFDARSSIKPSVLAALGGIDADSPMAHSSTTFIPARRLRQRVTV